MIDNIKQLVDDDYTVKFTNYIGPEVGGAYRIDIEKDGCVLSNLFDSFDILSDLMRKSMIDIAFKNKQEGETHE